MNTDSNFIDPILEVREITRHFGGLIAVNKVSFAVSKGEIFGAIGPNGAGKTTLFNIITGLLLPSSGKLIYQGEELIKQKPHQIAKKGIARTFQNLRLFDNLSALENVAIAHHLHDRSNLFSGILGLPKIKIQQQQTYFQALKLLELVGIANKAEQQARNLAYGDRRRLEIARALALKPQVLLLDEPAAGMNTNEKGSLSELIKQIRDDFNLTILLIEHHVPLVMGLCDRIAVLDFGELIALGKPESVRNDPAVIEAYLGE
jgi:branched-chain amino acid transport system ATP-binding protein